MKQIPVSLTVDEIKTIRLALETQTQSITRGLANVEANSVREIVEGELVCIKKIDLYLNEIIDAEQKCKRS